jgi:hypothetical protein
LFEDKNGTAGVDAFILRNIDFQKFVVKITGDQRATSASTNLRRHERMPALKAPSRFGARDVLRPTGLTEVVRAWVLWPGPSEVIKEHTAIIR